jgi:hypothetical protein
MQIKSKRAGGDVAITNPRVVFFTTASKQLPALAAGRARLHLKLVLCFYEPSSCGRHIESLSLFHHHWSIPTTDRILYQLQLIMNANPISQEV